jgi:hypothetical protein
MITIIVIVIGICVTRFRVSTIAATRAASVIIAGNFPTVVTVSQTHNTYNSGVSYFTDPCWQ